ncbi:hypothetical protein E8E11_000312 [Didymella keratinophila]|nr:hypothetical protein E8E11_000312 [Didymella keratinophila]
MIRISAHTLRRLRGWQTIASRTIADDPAGINGQQLSTHRKPECALVEEAVIIGIDTSRQAWFAPKMAAPRDNTPSPPELRLAPTAIAFSTRVLLAGPSQHPSGAEAPQAVIAQAENNVVPTTADPGLAPTVPGSVRSITPSTRPSEVPKRPPWNYENLHRDPFGVPIHPRGQPTDHVGLADSPYAIQEGAAVQTRDAAEQGGAEFGDRQTQLPTTVVPPVLENEHSPRPVSQNTIAPDAAISKPISKKAKCSIAQRGGRKKPGLSREEVTLYRAAAAFKASANPHVDDAEIIRRPPKDVVKLQKPYLVSPPSEKLRTRCVRSSSPDGKASMSTGPLHVDNTSQRASNSPQIAARTLTIAPEASRAPSKDPCRLSTSPLLSPALEKACAPSTTSDKSQGHASTADERSTQHARFGVKAEGWSTSSKDASAKKVQAEVAAALVLDLTKTDQQEKADADYHLQADKLSDEDSENAPLMSDHSKRRSQVTRKSTSTATKEKLAVPAPKKRRISRTVSNAVLSKRDAKSITPSSATPASNSAKIEARKSIRGVAITKKNPKSPGSPSKAPSTDASSTVLSRTRKVATSSHRKVPSCSGTVDDQIAPSEDASEPPHQSSTLVLTAVTTPPAVERTRQPSPPPLLPPETLQTSAEEDAEVEDDEHMIRLKLEAVEHKIQLARIAKRKATV